MLNKEILLALRAQYPWTDDMGEISGFGGGYEEACRDMLRAGLLWFREHPFAVAELKVAAAEKRGVGSLAWWNTLEQACAAGTDGASGAQVGATAGRAQYLACHDLDWTAYQAECRAWEAKVRSGKQ